MRSKVTEGLLDRVLDLPSWVQPMFLGPVILIWLVILRGGIILIPLSVLFVLIEGGEALPGLLIGVQVFGVALLGSAVGGLAYGVLGRPLRKLPGIGRYLAGWVAVFPYMVAVSMIVQWEETGDLFAPLHSSDWVIAILLSVFFGSIIGHSLFGEESLFGAEGAQSLMGSRNEEATSA